MNKLLLFKEATVALVFAFFTLINIIFWQSAYGGWVILVLFLLYFSAGAHRFLRKIFDVSDSLRIRVLSGFLVLSVVGSIGGILSLVYKMSPWSLAAAIFLTGLLFGYLKLSIGDSGEISDIEDYGKQVVEEWPTSKIGPVLFLVLSFFGFYFLFHSQSDSSLLSPWQAISPRFIWIFFAATFVLGLLIFSRLKSGALLFLLIIHALLLHAYLPLSHNFFYGADSWRHLATQSSWWQNGSILPPQLSADPVGFWQRLDVGTMAYAQFNTLFIFIEKVCRIDPVFLTRYFLPIVWAVIFPIILFETARALGMEKKPALFLVWLSAWPFALQASGSFSLPINFSLLFWMLVVWLMLKNSQRPSLVGGVFLTVLGVLLSAGHTVFFVLFWIAFALISLLKINFFKTKIGLTILFLFTALAVPTIELASGFSSVGQLEWWSRIKAVVGSFTGWYVGYGLRAGDIGAGNIFFNQPPLSALYTNFFTAWRGWIPVLMAVFWVAWLIGNKKMLDAKKITNNFWVIFSVGLFFGYIISRYFLSGENIIARRLDAILAVLLLLPAVNFSFNFLKNKIIIFLAVTILSFAATASYALGPDTRVVSAGEYEAMAYIWNKEKAQAKICVLADTFPLLALEQISGRRVVGGGFPIDSNFAQPERLILFKLASSDIKLAATKAASLIGSDSCYVVMEKDSGAPMAQFRDIKVYNF